MRTITDLRSFREIANDVRSGTRIPIEVRVTVSDPFIAYRRVRNGDGGAYLETTGGQTGWGYFGIDPIDQLEVDPDPQSSTDSPSLTALAERLDRETVERGPCEVPYPCGAIGWLSYDIARELEELPAETVDDRALPRLQLGIYDRFAAWKEPCEGETELRITACPVVESIEPAYERGLERAQSLARAVIGDTATEEPGQTTGASTFESDCGRAEFRDRVRRIKQYIRDGDTFQANISHRLRAPATVSSVDVFAALRRVNPAPYSALLEFPGVDLISASPELLLYRNGDHLLTEPIAGTRPRGDTTTEDEQLEAELVSDEKERAEHAMLVDLARNDLGKVAEYGSVEVTDYRRVDRYSEVMHLVSTVEGTLSSEYALRDAIAALFPAGTITGAPKPRTMELIDEVETTQRGPYTGGIGLFGFDDRTTLNILIRTIVRHQEEFHLRVGAGIVHDSVPDQEYDETLDKARGLIAAVDDALGDQAELTVKTP